MLITELKSKDEILSVAVGKTAVISCEGCSELRFPVIEVAEISKDLLENGAALFAINTEYICNPDHLRLQLQKHADLVKIADTILVFSCGVGVQTVAEMFPNKKVFAACDTYPLPGHQGLSPPEYGCDQCGECHLNDTGGICPITSCSKSLVNGQCGGSKDGKCEVNRDMDCGWARIYRRLETQERLEALSHPVTIRNFNA